MAAQRSASCSVDEFGADDFTGVFFTFVATDTAGGHRSATATLSARDLGIVKTIVFDVIAGHSMPVTTASDFGEGSLRAAIEEINANPLCGTDVPCFIGIGSSFSAPITIAPATRRPPKHGTMNMEHGTGGPAARSVFLFPQFRVPCSSFRVGSAGMLRESAPHPASPPSPHRGEAATGRRLLTEEALASVSPVSSLLPS